VGWRRLLCAVAVGFALASCGPGAKRRASVPPPVAPLPIAELPPLSSDPVIPPEELPPPDPTELLIAEAEKLYAAGLEDYRSGNLDKARQDFDQSLSLLLQSKLDVLGDDRLNTEFHKLLENIYNLEVAAVERGDALSERKYEPAPIEAFAGLTFPVDPRVKQRVQDEIKTVRSDLPLVSNDYVDGVITYFQGNGSRFIETVLKRAGQYQKLFSEALRQEGLPQDLIYLAAAESGYNPFALSRAGAKGIWQLMLGRAIEYGLKKDRWVDEREDPAKSTSAAVRHLKDLYQQFGDWYLAMAAYNCGPVNVQKAIEKTGYADFWMLRQLHALPVDTENYVPIIIATALIAKDPEAYGFNVQPDAPLETDQVVVSVPTDLRLIAQITDHPVEELIRLNPGLLRWTTPANNPEFVLNLPLGTREAYQQGIELIPPDKRIWWRTHKVAEGDTLPSVARKFRVTPVALARANGLERDAELTAGDRLVLPLAPGSESSLARVRERGPRRPFWYRVKAGDTLERIADRFDVTPYQLRRWNTLQSSRLVAGKRLRVYVATGASRPSRPRRAKAVASGAQANKKPAPAGSPPTATPKPAQRASQPAR
jgi:membrane-bound lytic murein transglycosylase D